MLATSPPGWEGFMHATPTQVAAAGSVSARTKCIQRVTLYRYR